MRKQKWNEAWEFYCEEQAESRKTVDLPYDAMIYEKRQPRCINAYNTGYYPGGRYVYTKRFPVEKKEHMVVEFEGVFGITEVYLNGKKNGRKCIWIYRLFCTFGFCLDAWTRKCINSKSG